MRLRVISVPVILEGLAETARWFLFFVIIEQLGESALAGVNIVYCWYAMLLVPVEGFSEGVCSMVSNLIGQGAWSRIRLLLRRAMWLAFAVTVPLLVAAALMPGYAIGLFTDEASIVVENIPSLLVVTLTLLVAIPGELLLATVLGSGDSRAVLWIEVAVGICVLAGAAAATLLLDLGLAYVWLAVLVGWVVGIALSAWRLRRRVWADV